MSSVSTSVIQELKRNRSNTRSETKLKHKELRKILKKERRRSKRKEEAIRRDSQNPDHESVESESEDEEYLRSKNLWLMRETRLSGRQQRESKRQQAIQRAEKVLLNLGLDPKSQSDQTEGLQVNH